MSRVRFGSGRVWVGFWVGFGLSVFGSIRVSGQNGSGRVWVWVAHDDRFSGAGRVWIRASRVGFLGSGRVLPALGFGFTGLSFTGREREIERDDGVWVEREIIFVFIFLVRLFLGCCMTVCLS